MKKRVFKKISLLLILSLVAIASFAYGIFSATSQNTPFKIIRAGHSKIFSKSESGPIRKGVWRVARNNARSPEISKEQQEAINKISTLPYLKGYNLAPDVDNVTIYDERLAYNGLNFIVTGDEPKASLMDMKGNVLHEWRKDFEDVWPKLIDLGGRPEHNEYWQHAEVLNNGDVLAVFAQFGLIKLDKNSNLLWAYKGRCHHDLFVAENGNVYVLTRKEKKKVNLRLESQSVRPRIFDDFITILNPEGKELRSISIVDCFLNSVYASLLEHVKVGAVDILHTNTMRLIDGKLVDTHPMFKKGHLLMSMREIHTIAVVDPVQEKVTWALTGMWKYQHEPRLLENGNLLLFDNRGNNGKSKILEFDPLTQEVVWSYQGEPAEEFYSKIAGKCERLPNGNTLITESTNGRVFEVTSEGKIVWEFINPERAGENNELIAVLCNVVRLGPDQFDWLELDSKTE